MTHDGPAHVPPLISRTGADKTNCVPGAYPEVGKKYPGQ